MQHIGILWWVTLFVSALTGAVLGAHCAGVARYYSSLLDMGWYPDGACLVRALKLALAGPGISIIWADACVRDDTVPALLAGVAAGVLLPALYIFLGPTLAFVSFGVVVVTLVLLSCIDCRVGLLPDALTQPLLWLGVFCAWSGVMPLATLSAAAGVGALATGATSDSIAGVLTGYGVLSVPALWWRWRYRKEAIGQGDIKLLAAAGAWLGPMGVVHALAVACVFGAGFAALHQRRWRPSGAYPFGPFIALGCVGEILKAPGVQSWF